jgi:hypothetical protein
LELAVRREILRYDTKLDVELVIPEKPENAIRLVCMSDTHGHHKKHRLVPADIFIHGKILYFSNLILIRFLAGDFCNEGTEEEIDEFIDFLKSLPHPNKIVIGGNHEVSLDPKCATFELRQRTDPKPVPTEEIKKRLKEACTYLVVRI